MENKKYIQLLFSNTSQEQNELLIALLDDIGFKGFEETEDSLIACIDECEFNSGDLTSVLSLVPVNYSKKNLEDENWNAQWESSFEPIVVNDPVHNTPWVAIRAAFHQPVKNVKHEIIITPKMSFGTGHHATTCMMIEQMQGLDFTGKTVVDFGTGTAVLAILAEKMGAASVDAIDNDEWSIKNAIENTRANNCTKINLYKDETIRSGLMYDIILANINLNVILNNLAAIKSVGKKGCFILLSGFMKADEVDMLKNLAETGIYPLKTTQQGEWISMLTEIR